MTFHEFLTGRWGTRLVLFLLVCDAVVAFVVEALFLPSYVGATAMPVTIALAVVANLGLLYLARTVSDSLGGVCLPLAAWTIAFAAALLGGPGGDVVLPVDPRTLGLFAAGAVVPGIVLYWQVKRGYVR